MQADPLVSKVSELIRLNKMPSASEIRAGKVGLPQPHRGVISLARANLCGVSRILWRSIFHPVLSVWKPPMRPGRKRLFIPHRDGDDIALLFVCRSNSVLHELFMSECTKSIMSLLIDEIGPVRSHALVINFARSYNLFRY